MEPKYEVLNGVFGYTGFRGGQEPLIDALLSGRDAFGVMPTGGGKSLCYQIPALLLRGVTLVVSPLISLMQDQVMALKNCGVAAAYVNGSLTPEQIRLVYRNMALGEYKIVYVAPERLLMDGFLHTARRMEIAMLAVDEAHCISQWGQNFRPSYLRITAFLDALPRRPVVSAFTATATAQVREDVIRLLGLQEPQVVITDFDRPNLRFEVRHPGNKPAELLSLVRERQDKCGIVYCATRREVEEVCQQLQEHGLAATRYHAGLEDEERHKNQEDFVYDRAAIMVATNAFGMGINKSSVNFVIHYNMPQSMEAYYQEAGRAGRDGAAADCILLFAGKDVRTARYLIQHPSENEELTDEEREQVRAHDLERLTQMVAYCKTDRCLRGCILDYFGQKHGENCENCGNCSANLVEVDITRQAQMMLSTMLHIHRKLGYFLGPTRVRLLLRGSREKRIRELGLEELPTYGLLRDTPMQELREVMDALERQGYCISDKEHGGIYPTEKARQVLYAHQSVHMRTRAPAKPTPPEQKQTRRSEQPDEGLLQILKELRAKLALRRGVPAYVIFSNVTLQDMAARKPRTPAEFREVNGVGQYKANQYGKLFLTAIEDYLRSQ